MIDKGICRESPVSQQAGRRDSGRDTPEMADQHDDAFLADLLAGRRQAKEAAPVRRGHRVPGHHPVPRGGHVIYLHPLDGKRRRVTSAATPGNPRGCRYRPDRGRPARPPLAHRARPDPRTGTSPARSPVSRQLPYGGSIIRPPRLTPAPCQVHRRRDQAQYLIMKVPSPSGRSACTSTSATTARRGPHRAQSSIC